MNKTEPILQRYFINYFRYADNIKAVEKFTGNFQKSLDEYYLSICGEDRQKMPQKCLELERYVSDEHILHSTHVFKDTSYTASPGHIMLGEQVVKYFTLFELGDALCIALPRGIVEIANPKKICIENIVVCRIPNYPNKENNQRPFAVYNEEVRQSFVGVADVYPPVFNQNQAYYTTSQWLRPRKWYTIIVQAAEGGSYEGGTYAVYNQICNNKIVKELPRPAKLEDSTVYDWHTISGGCKSGRKFRDGAWTQP